MNLITIDIGNTNISIGLFLKGEETNVTRVPGDNLDKIRQTLSKFWQQIPVVKRSKEGKRNGVIIASSVKKQWLDVVEKIAKDELGEKVLLIDKDFPYPIQFDLKEKDAVGSDRITAAAAAFDVVERAVVVADFGTAVTIDMVDDRGVFVGGCILPGFKIAAEALSEHTAQLPFVEITKPTLPFGKSTTEAINCGLYYSAVGALSEIVRRYAETTGSWPQTVITGSGAKMIAEDCDFIDNYVPNLVIKGLALAYREYLLSKE